MENKPANLLVSLRKTLNKTLHFRVVITRLVKALGSLSGDRRINMLINN